MGGVMRDLFKVVAELERQRREAVADLQRIDDAIAALGGSARRARPRRARPRRARPRKQAVRKGRRFTKAQRKATSARMKKYWAARKAKET